MTVLLLAAVAFLIVCSAFFSSSEIVYASANRPRLKSAAEGGDRRARTALPARARRHPVASAR